MNLITIDNSVKYVPQIEQNHERDCKPKIIKNNSLPRKQDKSLLQNKKID